MSAPMRVAIVGSRSGVTEEFVRSIVRKLEPGTTVISGGARGVDTWAVDEARKLGLPVEVVPADWSKGKMAGKHRNWPLVAFCTHVIAIWDGWSNGTAHAVAAAVHLGRTVAVYAPTHTYAEHIEAFERQKPAA